MTNFIETIPVELFVVLAVCGLAIAWIHLAFGSRAPAPQYRSLGRDESGAAYSLPLVLIVPLYGLMIATVVETTLILNCRIGVQYAAFAAARAASVWAPAEIPERSRMGMIHVAASGAMAPFASGQDRHAVGASSGGKAAEQIDAMVEAYQTYSGGGAPTDYLAKKINYASTATEIAVEIESDEYDAPATVVVAYEVPFNIPLVGRFLGHAAPWGANHNTYTLLARATLGLERPKSADRSLGITYGRDLGFESDAKVPAEMDTLAELEEKKRAGRREPDSGQSPDAEAPTQADPSAEQPYVNDSLPAYDEETGKKIAKTAKGHEDSTDWRKKGFNWPYRWGSWKCNLFVFDMLEEVGLPIDKHEREEWLRPDRPPLAHEWANKDFEIKGTVVVARVQGKDLAKYAKTGDIISDGVHVAIVSETKNQTTSADEYKVVDNNWGFRGPGHEQGDQSQTWFTIRRRIR